MRGIPVIRAFTAFVMLIVFALSITSKEVLHDLLADHSDFTGVCVEPCENHIEATGIDCKCAQFVAELPFVPYEEAGALSVARHYAPWKPHFISSYFSCDPAFTEQRGPPAPTIGMPVA